MIVDAEPNSNWRHRRTSQLHIAGIAIAALVVSIVPAMTIQAADAAASTTRPISDFVDAQGTFCIDDGNGGCFLFLPPIPNYGGWNNQDFSRCASVDYAGIANAWFEGASGGDLSFGTTTSGRIIERELADGRAEVTVMLRTHNALTWVQNACNDFATDTLLFGNRAADVLNNDATPVLADSFMKIVFINSEPGAALPDLFELGIVRPDDLLFLSFTAKADGTLHEASGSAEGTPAKMTIVQTGIYQHEFNENSNVHEGDPHFAAERIELRTTD